MYDAQAVLKSCLALSIKVALPLSLAVTLNAKAETSDSRRPDYLNLSLGDLLKVVVTSQRREENLLDVPISITTLTQQDLDDAGVHRLRDTQHLAPNMIVTGPYVNGRPDFVIRGIQSTFDQPAFESSVSIYIDGVYMGRETSANPDLIDVERVEILRGPQGTLYGKNSIAGAINLVTAEPGKKFKSKVDLTTGEFERRRVTAMLNSPIIDDKLYIKIRGFGLRDEGYMYNTYRDENVNNENSRGLQLYVLSTPTDKLKVKITADGLWEDRDISFGEAILVPGQPAHPGYVSGDFQVAFNEPETEDREVSGVGLNIDYDIATHYKLTTVLGYRQSDIDVTGDFGESPLDEAFTDFHDEMEQLSAEIRLASPQEDRFNYVAGLFFYDARTKSEHNAFTGLDHPAGVSQILNDMVLDTTSYAVFANSSFKLSERWTLIAGGRYTIEKKTFDYSQFPDFPLNTIYADVNGFHDEISEKNFSPEFGLKFKVNDQLATYLKASRAFKSGGWSTLLVSSTDDLKFGSEYVTNYELGVKWLGLNNKLQLNTALFYMDYKDLQSTTYNVETQRSKFTNVAAATSKGVEIELKARPITPLTLWTSFGYTDASYDDFERCGPGGISCNGNRLIRAPEYTGRVAAQYHYALPVGKLILHSEAIYRGDMYFSVTNDPESKNPDYTLLNAYIGYQYDWLEASIWAQNLTDERVLNGVSLENSFIVPGNPRTAGLRFKVRL
ncbi:TonB-dependent receptor [Oleiphilus messinensis]|uniref:TonB-dependent receptor n=1 Tax=Oleiphilus messinensis TaxID=141451 RepID=A0A1Y0I5X1_9GAMM|nr:TonB-dependent receptor [Oleiphilus messinensis]ARU55196.1 TonB-dependent receptor [Oleiphilus messinensis]